ncbi:MAG: hypothetical protein S4CHLAM81_01700 [Chlamydiales bacterium]|nr:hypothetical protein [Chlamydiales bacterium]MCH9634966.1 hypothetical protein [Chlamydiales bacterium]MCH9704425.1 autotransporter domain-containing protein [Chlamydiota bacterium]
MRILVFLTLPAALIAADIDVPPNQTTNQTLPDTGDTLTVGANGSIIVSDAVAVLMNATNQTVNNAGLISTSGIGSSYAISASNTSAAISNSGTISTTGTPDGYGIYIAGSNSHITNSGIIRTTGTDSDGIRVDTGGTNVMIHNSGIIETSGPGGYGVTIAESNGLLINSGTIKSDQTSSLFFTAANPTLKLLKGSNLQGPITSSGGGLNLQSEEGMNLLFTMDASSVGFASLNIGSPFVTVGANGTLASIDRTGFIYQTDFFEDLTDSIQDSIYRWMPMLLTCHKPSCGVWAKTLGSYRICSNEIAFYDWISGGLAGANWEALYGTLGVYGGGTYGEAHISNGSQESDLRTGLGGLTYEQLMGPLFFGFSMAAGYVNWKNEREILDNLVAGGVNVAKAETDGWFLSPEITAAGWGALNERWGVLLSSTLRYSGLFLGSYSEKGSSSNFKVHNRHIDLMKLRGEFSFVGHHEKYGHEWELAPYVGVAGLFQVGGTRVRGELLNQPLAFSAVEKENMFEFLYGMRAEWIQEHLIYFGHVQGLRDNVKCSRVLAELGFLRLF